MEKEYAKREYSILLIPKGEIHTKLSKIINKLSDKYNLPKFKPHITLIGKINKPEKQIISETLNLSKNLKPYEIKINKQVYFNKDYKSLFLKARKTKKVINANLIARKFFKEAPEEKYLPHLSLMYKNASPKIKKQIILQIKDLDLEFKVNKIHLFSTANGPKNWYKIKEFNLK